MYTVAASARRPTGKRSTKTAECDITFSVQKSAELDDVIQQMLLYMKEGKEAPGSVESTHQSCQ